MNSFSAFFSIRCTRRFLRTIFLHILSFFCIKVKICKMNDLLQKTESIKKMNISHFFCYFCKGKKKGGITFLMISLYLFNTFFSIELLKKLNRMHSMRLKVDAIFAYFVYMLFAIAEFGQCPKYLDIPRSGHSILLTPRTAHFISDNALINLLVPRSEHFDLLISRFQASKCSFFGQCAFHFAHFAEGANSFTHSVE